MGYVYTFLGIVLLAILVFEFYCMWRTYEKAGAPGWASIIPIYNIIVLFRIANVALWMFILLFVPIVNLYVLYLIYSSLAVRLGKSKIYGILTILVPFVVYPIYAFSKEEVKTEYVNQDPPNLMSGPIEPINALQDQEVVEDEDEQYDIPATEDLKPGIMGATELDSNIEENRDVEVNENYNILEKSQQEEDEEYVNSLDEFMTCPSCGAKLKKDSTICFLCGKKLEE